MRKGCLGDVGNGDGEWRRASEGMKSRGSGLCLCLDLGRDERHAEICGRGRRF